jgi:hypothetical protein
VTGPLVSSTDKTDSEDITVTYILIMVLIIKTRGSVGGACVTHLSFCFEETYYRTFHRCFHQVSIHLAKQLQRRRFLETRMACGGHVY